MSYETDQDKSIDSTDSNSGTYDCPGCGEQSEKCYRCTNCGRDLVRGTAGGGR